MPAATEPCLHFHVVGGGLNAGRPPFDQNTREPTDAIRMRAWTRSKRTELSLDRLKGVKYRPKLADRLLSRNLLIYGVAG
jgi:hypothetical protein